MYCCMPSVLHIFVPESKLQLTLFICSTPPHDCLQFHDFTYYAVAVLVVVMAVIVYFPFLTFCSTNRTCFLTTKEQTYSKINAIFDFCICIVFKERASKGLNYQGDQSYTQTYIHIVIYMYTCVICTEFLLPGEGVYILPASLTDPPLQFRSGN